MAKSTESTASKSARRTTRLLVSNLLAKVRSLGLLSLCAHLLIALALLALVLFLFPSYLKPYWPSGYDTFGHLAKVEFLTKMLSQGSFVNWSDEWFSGYHPLFYPPLSHIFPTILRLLSLSANLVARMSFIAGLWVAALSGYILGLAVLHPETGARSKILALVSGIVYMSTPALLALFTIGGEFANFWAAALAPLPVASLLLLLQQRKLKYIVTLAVSLSAVFLMHGHIATPVVLGCIFAAFLYDLRESRLAKIKDVANSRGEAFHGFIFTLLAVLLFVGLTAFWWLPYFVESPVLANAKLANISRLAEPLSALITRGFANGTPRYLGLIAIFLACLGIFLGNRRRVVALTGIAATGLLMFLGPSWSSYSTIPLIGLVFSWRAIPTITVAIAGLATLGVAGVVSKINRLIPERDGLWLGWILSFFKSMLVPLAFAVVASTSVVADASFVISRAQTKPMQDEFLKLNSFLAAQPRPYGARVAFIPSYALETYSPVLSGWPILGGYVVETSNLSSEIYWVLSREIKAPDRRAALAALTRWNVAYIAVDHRAEPGVAEILKRDASFSKIYSDQKYSLFRYNLVPGYLAPSKSVLVVGDPTYVRETIERSSGGEASSRMLILKGDVDDLRGGRYDALVFPGGPMPSGFEKELERKVREGVVAMVGLDGTGVASFLGVKVRSVSFRGPLPVANSKEETHVADATYNQGPWDTVEFEGLDEVWLTTGKKALAGVKRIGKGQILFLGFNPFYHAVYKNDEWEKRELATMYRSLIEDKSHPASFSYKPLRIMPGSKLFEIDSIKPTSLLISSSWSPYWKAYLDDRPLSLGNAQKMMVIEVPQGRHRLWFKFTNWSPISVAAIAISLITLVLAIAGAFLVKLAPTKEDGKHPPGRQRVRMAWRE